MKKITFGDMRACKLPAEKADEGSVLASIRMNVASKHPDRMRIAVPDELAAMVEELTPKPAKPADDKTKK